LRICIVGKYPPIQGGVSARTYWTAHSLAARGHDVHVVTNAKEASPPFRMHMRPEDWARCDASYGTGSVTVHWTDPVDRSQSYIPMASPFVTKLASIAASAHAAHRFDVIYSHYLEPYGVAAHLAAQMISVPHVVRTAGSDAGRLWRHPQFEALYDHVLCSAQAVVTGPAVAPRAVEHGVDPGRIVFGGGYAVPEDWFAPQGPRLDVRQLRAELEAAAELRDALWGGFAADRPYFGIYGKLGESKGSFAMLCALDRLKHMGADVGLIALAHGGPQIETRFRAQVQELGLTDRVLQIPFLPHWRVPEFLRGCLAVCCLEQDFPIGFHSPITPLEVLNCGACLVGSTEVIKKLPGWERLPHGYGCVAIKDVNDIPELSSKLAAIAVDPGLAEIVGARGRKFAQEAQQSIDFPQRIERILQQASRREPPAKSYRDFIMAKQQEIDRFPFSRMAIEELAKISGQAETMIRVRPQNKEIDLESAKNLLLEIKRAAGDQSIGRPSLVQAVEAEIAIASAEDDGGLRENAPCEPLFRLHSSSWAIGDLDFKTLVPVRNCQFCLLRFEYDVSEFRGAKTIADLPAKPDPHPSYAVVFPREADRDPLIVDAMTSRFLELIDGRKTVAEILGQLKQHDDDSTSGKRSRWIEDLFVLGLIGLREAPISSPDLPTCCG
jgi:glycosyltransferase involved in cell wall biosynthesis